MLTHILIDLVKEVEPVERAKGQKAMATTQPYSVMEELSSLWVLEGFYLRENRS